MKALSARAANDCEHAQTKRCRCRCGGQYHGAARGWVGALPVDDPHHPGAPWQQLVLPFPKSSRAA